MINHAFEALGFGEGFTVDAAIAQWKEIGALLDQVDKVVAAYDNATPLGPDEDETPSGPVPASLAKETGIRSTPVTRGELEAAIWSKAQSTPTRPSQLALPLADAPPGGHISVSVTHAACDPATATAAVQSLAPRLGRHVEHIDVTILAEPFSARDALRRQTISFRRAGAAFVQE